MKGVLMPTLTKRQPRYVVDPDGRQTDVILPLREYAQLLEDLEDLAIVAERKDDPVVSHSQVVAELKADG
jgi:hypothetical protein